ncbi:MAG TPA: hypothetical protein VN752_13065 [Solirubrobacterales bacterium]|nr:hypothetical protein [Solirubrobacterales bacterium]
MSGPVQQPDQPESPKKTWEEQIFEAEVADLTAQAEGRRLKAEDESLQLRADIDLKREKQAADVRDRQVRTDAEIDREGKKLDAEIDDQGRRLGAEMAALESDTETTRHERYFYMGVAAVGLAVAAVLALLGHQFSPGFGLLISGGAGYRLHAIKQGRKPFKAAARVSKGGEWETSFSESSSWERDF